MGTTKMKFDIFKEELTKQFVYLPEERPDWEQWMNEWYVDYKLFGLQYSISISEWAKQWFEDYTLQDHGMMLKEKAVAQRDELIKEGYKFKPYPINQ